MILLCLQSNFSWFPEFIQKFVFPFTVAFFAYYLFGKRDEYKKRGKYSILGSELILTLIEEVETGYNIIIEPLHPTYYNKLPLSLPNKSWNGINTIPDEILLRIFEVTSGIPDEGFPAKEIRIHTKNYFEHIIPNWEQMVKVSWVTSLSGGDDSTILEYKQNYGVAAGNVLKMLYHVKSLLDKNANRWFPK